jgi:hypothetical protein
MTTYLESGFDEPLSESEQFDAQWLHNFGPETPTPIGAVAKCGAVYKKTAAVQFEPLRVECCPICLALTENEL